MLERRRPRSIVTGPIVLEELIHANRGVTHLGAGKPGELAGQIPAARAHGNPGRTRPAGFTINAGAIGKRKAEFTITDIFQRLAGHFHAKGVLHCLGRAALAHPLAELGIAPIRNHDQRGSGHAGLEKCDRDQIVAADGRRSRTLGVTRSMTQFDGFPGCCPRAICGAQRRGVGPLDARKKIARSLSRRETTRQQKQAGRGQHSYLGEVQHREKVLGGASVPARFSSSAPGVPVNTALCGKQRGTKQRRLQSEGRSEGGNTQILVGRIDFRAGLGMMAPPMDSGFRTRSRRLRSLHAKKTL